MIKDEKLTMQVQPIILNGNRLQLMVVSTVPMTSGRIDVWLDVSDGPYHADLSVDAIPVEFTEGIKNAPAKVKP